MITECYEMTVVLKIQTVLLNENDLR